MCEVVTRVCVSIVGVTKLNPLCVSERNIPKRHLLQDNSSVCRRSLFESAPH